MDRRNFIKSSAVFGGALAALGPFQALSARRALGAALPQSEGYGALVNKGHLWLPSGSKQPPQNSVSLSAVRAKS